MSQINFNDKNTILVDTTDKYSLYYNTESKIISISNGIEQYGVNVESLGNSLFINKKRKEGKNDRR